MGSYPSLRTNREETLTFLKKVPSSFVTHGVERAHFMGNTLSTYWGELASLGAALSWAIALCLYRRWGYGVASWGLNLLKNYVGLAGLTLLLLIFRPPFPVAFSIYLSLCLSGLLGIALGDTAAYAVLRHLGAPAASATVCLGPPLSALLAFLFLGETLTAREMLGISITVAGVAGTLFYTSHAKVRADETFTPSKKIGAIWMVLSGTGHAVGAVLSRYGLPHVDPFVGTFLRLLPAQVFLIVFCFYRPSRLGTLKQDPTRLRILVGTGVLGTFLGLILMSIGLKFSKAGVATALLSTYPVWVLPIAHHFLKEPVRWQSWAFTLMAVIGCATIVLG